jgi:hypothetical protein
LDTERKPDWGKELGRRIILEIFFGADKKCAERREELRFLNEEGVKTWKSAEKNG